jgi:hypothetical protein
MAARHVQAGHRCRLSSGEDRNSGGYGGDSHFSFFPRRGVPKRRGHPSRRGNLHKALRIGPKRGWGGNLKGLFPHPKNFGSSPNSLVAQTRFLVARARKQAPKPKRAGRSLLCSLLFVSAKRRGGQGIAGLKRRKPAFRKEEPPPFLARRMLFCPGRQPVCFRERPLFAEPSENKTSSEIDPFSFSTKLKMIKNF